jgi:IclR family acetate operon transcriptional repressor
MNINSLYWRSVCELPMPVKAVVQHYERLFILLDNFDTITLTMAASSDSPSAAVERALAMLEAVSQVSDGLSNAEISRKLNIPKSSASYILRTLEAQGYLTRDSESGKYRVGLKILSLSRGALGGLDVRGVALPVMRHLTHQTGLTCHLAVLDGSDAVYIEKVEPEGFIRMDTWVGRRMRVHATSVGKAIVAYLPQDQLEEILRKSGMEKRTPKTISTVPRLLKELEKVRAQGYAVDDEENNLGARCVGAPVFDERGSIEASLGLSGTTQQVSPQTMPRILEALKDAARHISMGMGYRSPHRRASGT